MSKRPNTGILNLIILIALYFISLRGLVVLFFSVNSIYWVAGALFYLLGAIGIYKVHICNIHLPARLKKLLYVNFILMAYWTMSEILVGSEDAFPLTNSFLLLGVAPFSMILFKNLGEKSIRVFLSVVTVVVSLSVFYDFVQINDFFGFGNLDAAVLRNELLRPSFGGAFGKSNNLYRPVGLLGSIPHHSAQINSMLAVYWFLLSFNIKKYRHFIITFGLFVCSFIAVLLSFVVSNIIAMFVGLGIGLIINVMYWTGPKIKLVIQGVNKFRTNPYLKKNISKLFAIVLSIAVIIVFIIWLDKSGRIPQIIEGITLRAYPETGDFENMLDWRMGSLASDLFSFLFGHGALVGSIMETMEIGFLGLIFQFGIFVALPFFYLMTYPIGYLLRRNCPFHIRQHTPEVMTILTGILTMWHYKSLLQTPNMLVFLVIYSSAVAGCHKLSPASNFKATSPLNNPKTPSRST